LQQSKTLKTFEKLPLLTQLAHHNLWKNHWLGEPISDETKDYFTKNPEFLVKASLLENDNPFALGAFANIDNSNHPATPTYQSDSDSDIETSHDDSISCLLDNNSSDPFDISDRQVILYSDINNNINMSDDEVTDNNDNNSHHSSISNPSNVDDAPKQQIGFNGQVRSILNTDSSIFISNQKQIRLTSGHALDHDIIRKFCDQCLASDFRTTIEGLIDEVTWKVITLRALSLYADNSSKSKQKISDIQELALYVLKKDTDYVYIDTEKWNTKTVCALLLQCYPKVANFNSRSSSFYNLLREIFPSFDLTNQSIQDEFFRTTLNTIHTLNGVDVTDEQQLLVIKTWIECWPKPLQTCFKVWVSHKPNKTVTDFISNLSAYSGEARLAKGHAESFLWTVVPNANTSCYQGHKKRSNDDEHRQDSSSSSNNKKNKGDKRDHTDLRDSSTPSLSKGDDSRCNVCNRLQHPGNSCPYYSWHPNANKDAKVPFESSKTGMSYISAHKKSFRYLDSNDTDGNPLTNVPRDFKQPHAPKSNKSATSSSSGSSGFNKKKGKFSHDERNLALSSYFANLLSAIDSSDISNTLISCTAFLSQTGKSADKGTEITVEALLDSGSLAGNFISLNTFTNLGGDPSRPVDRLRLPICSGLNNRCTEISLVNHAVNISFVSENLNLIDFDQAVFSFSANFRILPETPFDIIIGKETIKYFNLPLVLPSHFFRVDSVKDIQKATHPLLPRSMLVHGLVSGEKDNNRQAPSGAQPTVGCHERLCGCHSDYGLQPEFDLAQTGDVRVEPVSRTHTVRTEGEQLDRDEGCYSLPPLASAQTHDNLLATLVKETQDLFATTNIPDDEIDYEKTDAFRPFLVPDKIIGRNNFFPDDPLLGAIQIEGNSELTTSLVLLIAKYAHLFQSELTAEPAEIPSFDLNVDLEKWRNPKNRGPPRVQSSANQAETVRQIDLLLAQNIIERSDASYYSQVLLTPKPDGSKRFVIDYRKLNDCTESASWPLLNIKQMFVRLGTHRSSIFGVVDLTSGYHQAPVSLAARVFTAFITFCGVYQYLRLPFGPKRAPSYFQEVMAAFVLAGLVYFICEIYLDDCIIHAADNKTFIDRLEQVFQRFSKHKIVLKPTKCRFGMSEVEFCGRVISHNGIHMSAKKISQVLDFPLPEYMKQLKSFLGLVNYFSPHIRDKSNLAHPLNQMLADYHRSTVLKWTDETKETFFALQKLVCDCPLMHFVDPDVPLYLHTDASDYGIGGYLFQIVDGVERPCAFISQSLHDNQLRWNTLQKEAYSIFYCCKELDYLLRDRQFVLRTDHNNLRFIHDSSNNMVIRWFMALQELDFLLEHIAGIKNFIADALSRLCANYMKKLPKEFSADDIYISAILPVFTIPVDKYALLTKVHNSVAGHHGVERTIKKLLDSYPTWPYLRQHVKKFVHDCPLCQKISAIKLKIHAHPFVTSRYSPMECINIDYVGPFPDGGYVLVIIDCFTRWLELYAVDSATGELSAFCLLQHFGRFGAPAQIRSDRGSHFVNTLIREFLAMIGTEHCLTLAYSKEENALVERANKEVNRHLRAFTFDSNTVDNWRISLPMVQRIMNATFSDRTKLSSAKILFGNAINLDRGIFAPPSEVPRDVEPLSDYMVKLLALQDNIIALARDNIVFTDSMQLGNYPSQRTEYAPLSYVLVKYREGAPPSRLHTMLKGPLRVIRSSESKYTLEDLITNKEKDYHISDIKPFYFDPLNTNPVDVARKDYLEFFIEAIVKHSGTKQSKKGQLKFYIKWLGYDDDQNTWEPFSNIRDMTICHDYLRSHGMANHIPSKFTA
jgi:transposase InsO family protein